MELLPTTVLLDMTQHFNVIYGWSLPQFIHHLVYPLRIYFPHPLDFVCSNKSDHSDACRRASQHSASAAIMTISILATAAYISVLRVTLCLECWAHKKVASNPALPVVPPPPRPSPPNTSIVPQQPSA